MQACCFGDIFSFSRTRIIVLEGLGFTLIIENTASKWKCTVSAKYAPSSEYLLWKQHVRYRIHPFCTDHMFLDLWG